MNETNMNGVDTQSPVENIGGCGCTEPSGCCQKMMAACKDMCTRFLDARIAVTYSISTDIKKASDGKAPEKASGKTQAGCKNSMVKEGSMEIRALDLTVGMMVACAFMSVMAMIKGFCCRK